MIFTQIKTLIEARVSDIFLKEEEDIYYKETGLLKKLNYKFKETDGELFKKIYLNKNERKKLSIDKKLNKAIYIYKTRFRCIFYYSMEKLSIDLRRIEENIIGLSRLGIESIIKPAISEGLGGLIIICGSIGSGKSMTLTSIIDYVNRNYAYRIVSLEDPIEIIHKNKKSFISQRELEKDFRTFTDGIEDSLRQATDILVVGEVRKALTLKNLLTAAETGTLVITTMHSLGLAKTIDRIIDLFPHDNKFEVRCQLSSSLKLVIYQRLKLVGKEQRAYFDILKIDRAVSNLIRKGQINQIESVSKIISI